jgi:hypothetical protein
MRLKQRIVRILVHEIVVDVNEKDHEVVLLIHWAGGRHSELREKIFVVESKVGAPAWTQSRYCGKWPLAIVVHQIFRAQAKG